MPNPAKNEDLHGNVPDKSPVALLIVDMINDLEWPGGDRMAVQIMPDHDDDFVLKPKHSGFYSTTLETLLAYLKAKTLILTGIAGNNCVLFTAADAFLRDYYLVVPSDCTASINPEDNAFALKQM